MTLLDGDLVRQHLSSELGFSREHRDVNIRRIGFVAAESHAARRHRDLRAHRALRRGAGRTRGGRSKRHGGFVLVHVSTPIAVCEARDRKGLYAKARAGLVKEFTGVSDPYEAPADAEITIDTSALDRDAAVGRLVGYLSGRGFSRK